MAWRSGSLCRSLISSVRSSPLRSNASFSRLRPPPLSSSSRPQSRRFSFSASRLGWKRRLMHKDIQTFKAGDYLHIVLE